MVFSFDKKILIIQQFMRVESAFDIAKNITFIIGTLLNVIYSKKFLEKKIPFDEKICFELRLVTKTTFLVTQNFN